MADQPRGDLKWAAELMGRTEADPLVSILAEMRAERDACEAETARAVLTRECSRFAERNRVLA